MRNLKAGQKMVLALLPGGKIKSLTFPLTETSYVEATPSIDEGFVAVKKEVPTDKQVVEVACSLRGSLYESLQRCDVDQALAPFVADLLAGQIDFFTDSRKGDVLRIAVEKESLGGKFLRYGRVQGLLYEGRLLTASAFPVDSGDHVAYYDADGDAAERPFLRSPVKYSRVSSDFSQRRLHPILHTFTPHRAMDYAAPKGTPVFAVGDGRVVFNGNKGPNGNLLVIEHASGYQSYYAHLSHTAKGLKTGDKVARGTLIAFVGTTGRTTGPHLHFAVAQSGQFIHPRKLLDLPGAKLPGPALPDFKAGVGRIVGRLKALPVRGADGTRS